MAKGKVQVSPEFSKFYGKNTVAIEEAKKAENTLSSGPCEVGWEGKCVLLEALAEQGKDKKDDKGNVVPGNPRIVMKFGIVDDEKYKGKEFKKYWVFFNTANMSAMGRFEMFLNEAERMGLPRSVREGHESPQELLQFFTDSEFVFDVKCEADNYSSDKKKMTVTKPIDAVDSSDSMVPDTYSAKEDTPSPEVKEEATAPDFKEGDKVKFLGQDWEVMGFEGDKVVIYNEASERTRPVPASAISKA